MAITYGKNWNEIFGRLNKIERWHSGADGQIWIIYEVYSSFGIIWIMLNSNLHPFLMVLLSHKNSWTQWEHGETFGYSPRSWKNYLTYYSDRETESLKRKRGLGCYIAFGKMPVTHWWCQQVQLHPQAAGHLRWSRGSCWSEPRSPFFLWFWLCWVSLTAPGLSLATASDGCSPGVVLSLSSWQLLLLRNMALGCVDFPIWPLACGTFLDQGSNSRPLRWQADS